MNTTAPPSPRRARFFGNGELRLVVMLLLARKPSHGYELIKAIEAWTQGHYAPSPGVIYPTLMRLSDAGLIQEQSGQDGRRPLAITGPGKKWLEEREAQSERIAAHIRARNIGHALRQDPQMHRALDNLKMALDIRIHSQHATPEQIRQIVKLLDDTAAAIAQLP